MDEDGNTLQDEHLSMSVSITGCLFHPDARAYLMQDELKGLERWGIIKWNKRARKRMVSDLNEKEETMLL
jgi:hypothetical protein